VAKQNNSICSNEIPQRLQIHLMTFCSFSWT